MYLCQWNTGGWRWGLGLWEKKKLLMFSLPLHQVQIQPLSSCEISTSAAGTNAPLSLNFLDSLFTVNKVPLETLPWELPRCPQLGRMLDVVSLHTAYLEASSTLHAFAAPCSHLGTAHTVLPCPSIVRSQEQRPFSFTFSPMGTSCNSPLRQNNLNSGCLMRAVLCSAFVKSLLSRHCRAA